MAARFGRFAVGIALVIALSCADNDPVSNGPYNPTPPLITVVISPAGAAIAPGVVTPFDATISIGGRITWTITDTLVARIDTVDAVASRVTIRAVSAGTASVCAQSSDNAAIKGCASVRVH